MGQVPVVSGSDSQLKGWSIAIVDGTFWGPQSRSRTEFWRNVKSSSARFTFSLL